MLAQSATPGDKMDNPEMLRLWCLRHTGSLLLYARRKLAVHAGGAAEAEDLVQEAVIYAYQHWVRNALREDALLPMVLKKLKGLVIDFCRKQHAVHDDVALQNTAAPCTPTEVEYLRKLCQKLERALARTLEAYVKSCKPRDRALLVLHAKGESYEAIQKQLAIIMPDRAKPKAKQLKVQHHRARKRLQQLVERLPEWRDLTHALADASDLKTIVDEGVIRAYMKPQIDAWLAQESVTN
jgi:DNA-directed RNA polymerase specialized sigma24 family protein